MSILSWNCWGLENHWTINALKKLVKAEVPKLVFLMETKSNREWIVPSVGSSGGLALFWKDDINVHVQKYFMSHIDAFIDGGEGVGWWRLTVFMEI